MDGEWKLDTNLIDYTSYTYTGYRKLRIYPIGDGLFDLTREFLWEAVRGVKCTMRGDMNPYADTCRASGVV